MSELVINDVRFSYLNWAQPRPTPSGDMKYSVSILISKKDKKMLAAIDKAIKEAIAKGISDNKFTKAQASKLRLPIRDGSAEHKSGDRGAEYDDHFFINANSDRAPGVVMMDDKGRRVPILNEDDFYSGCYGHAHVNFFPYNTAGNRGIGAGLNNLMKTKDGERLDGRKSADDAFSKYGEEAEGPDEEDVF